MQDPRIGLVEQSTDRRHAGASSRACRGQRSTATRLAVVDGTTCALMPRVLVVVLHAVTQALHSMQRSASTRNLARAISFLLP